MYATYSVATADGIALTGLPFRRDEDQVVLRDGQGKEVILEAKDVEEFRPSRVSLMPDGQLADLTAREAADMIAYLASLR
jgi:putative heme-binding domain-containing protein